VLITHDTNEAFMPEVRKVVMAIEKVL